MELNRMKEQMSRATIEMHGSLGPGLLEPAYEALSSIPFEATESIACQVRGTKLGCGYRIDLLVKNAVVVENKTIAFIEPI